jgi:Phytanoyl-CoA dioxygenase (PhyH)
MAIVPTANRDTLRRHGFVYNQALAAGAAKKEISFSELCEEFPEDKIPLLDRNNIDETRLTPMQKQWRDHGFVVLKGAVPEKYIEEYEGLRRSLNLGKAPFNNFTPYLDHDVVAKITLSPALHVALFELLGQDMGCHFLLTAYHSTERGWHQDDYLNPDYVYSNYAAAWIATGAIHPDAGPFEFVPGSHKWPCMRGHLVKQHLSEEFAKVSNVEDGRSHWAAFAEVFTNDVYAAELERRNAVFHQFLADKGDIMIWHGRLVHRGSTPNSPILDRPSIISHYSGVNIRSDIGSDIRRYGEDGCHYWHFDR